MWSHDLQISTCFFHHENLSKPEAFLISKINCLSCVSHVLSFLAFDSCLMLEIIWKSPKIMADLSPRRCWWSGTGTEYSGLPATQVPILRSSDGLRSEEIFFFGGQWNVNGASLEHEWSINGTSEEHQWNINGWSKLAWCKDLEKKTPRMSQRWNLDTTKVRLPGQKHQARTGDYLSIKEERIRCTGVLTPPSTCADQHCGT